MESFDCERAQRMLRVADVAVGKYSVGRMTMDHLLHYMLTYVLLPRKRNHRSVNKEDLIILWAMVKEYELNWPYLIAHKLMYYTTGQIERGLGHGMLWTKVFDHFGIDLSGKDTVTIGNENAITTKHLNQMRRNVSVVVGGDNEGEAADKGVPHQPGVGSSSRFPSKLMESFSQGVQFFCSAWGESFQNMGERLDSFEAHLTSLEDEVRWLRDDIRGLYDRFPGSEDQGF
ncbi:hypothetical protein PIB30_084068 [Stylosanthes scabra]|uniref:Uncharacterized protein n=1 Tax=Stylosanthes scabra TaxID=79078 RepID=A0ABU6ZR69_9FABA|nr:hypothetical protein [Stylosanthes scabra]